MQRKKETGFNDDRSREANRAGLLRLAGWLAGKLVGFTIGVGVVVTEIGCKVRQQAVAAEVAGSGQRQ